MIKHLRREFPDWSGKLGDDHVVDLGVLGKISDTALTGDTAITFKKTVCRIRLCQGVICVLHLCRRPRLSPRYSSSRRRHVRNRLLGLSRLPRQQFKALQVTLSLGMERRFVIHTPLMWIDKAATWALAQELGGDALVEIVTKKRTPAISANHDAPLGLRFRGACPACELRRRGWEAFAGDQA